MLIKVLIFCNILLVANAMTCHKLLSELGDSQSKFVYCVTIHSVPVTMCNGCKDLHDNILHAYDDLFQSCNETFFDKDRINLVPSTEALLNTIWTKAYCDDCFNNNNSQIFEEKYTYFNNCVNTNHFKPCDACKLEYKDLNDFYLSLDRHNDGEVCFDIQDAMNRTRNQWSKVLQCCVRQYNVLYFSISLAITTSITLMFYCGTYFLTKRQERNHGVLNDVDPLFNSPSSSPATVAHLNISNNQTRINNTPPPPADEINNIEATMPQICKDQNKKLTKNVEESDNSSDDEPLIESSSYTKEKK